MRDVNTKQIFSLGCSLNFFCLCHLTPGPFKLCFLSPVGPRVPSPGGTRRTTHTLPSFQNQTSSSPFRLRWVILTFQIKVSPHLSSDGGESLPCRPHPSDWGESSSFILRWVLTFQIEVSPPVLLTPKHVEKFHFSRHDCFLSQILTIM